MPDADPWWKKELMTEYDAEDVIGAATRHLDDAHADFSEYPARLLARAGGVLLHALRRQARELERERARHANDSTPRIEGARLIDGDDGGGLRQYLRGEPVHCGATLCLLTTNGWMPGRYERSWHNATFWFSVPGVPQESVIQIQPDMLFAWPKELTLEQLLNGPLAGG